MTAPWYSLVCTVSGTKTGAVSGGPTTFTINPEVDFSEGESCTLIVDADQIADQVLIDPPDTMTADFSATFQTEVDVCTLAYTPIYSIQGSGAAAAITGSVSTQGVVVGDYEGASPTLRGFFLQDPTGDGNAATSDGIFVYNSSYNNVSLGDVVWVTGTAGEYQDQTQINTTAKPVNCGTGSVLPVDVTLPFPPLSTLSSTRACWCVPQTLTSLSTSSWGALGRWCCLLMVGLQQPTNIVVEPGAPALALQAANNLNRSSWMMCSTTRTPTRSSSVAAGCRFPPAIPCAAATPPPGMIGVMTYTWSGNAASGNAYRIRPIRALHGYVNFEPSNPRPDQRPGIGGDSKSRQDESAELLQHLHGLHRRGGWRNYRLPRRE